MKLITRYIVDHVTIASKHHDTGEIVVSKKVEQLKGVTFNEQDFVEVEDGSNMRTEPDGEGGIIKINYRYYKPELIEIVYNYSSYGENRVYFRTEAKARDMGHEKCYHCGKWSRQNTRYICRASQSSSALHFCSEACANAEGFDFCTECGRLRPVFELSNYFDFNRVTGRLVCNHCRETNFFTCSACGGSFSKHERVYARVGVLCRHCFEQMHEELKDYDIDCYHTAKDDNLWRFFKTPEDETSVDYIGTELEVEAKKYDPENVTFEARKILNKTSEGVLAHFEHDGSLDDGVEIIFNPMSLNYIYSQESLFKTAFEKLSNMARSHDTTTCGLHIHYSRGKFNLETIARLVYLFEKFRPELEVFARRRNTHYAQFYGWGSQSIDYVKSHIDYNSSRYRAVNLRNSDTIEIRIFKGTLKFSTYMASIELVNNFMQAALKFSNEETENLTFEEIINLLPTKYLIPYCEEKHLLEKEIAKVEVEWNISYLKGGDSPCVLPF